MELLETQDPERRKLIETSDRHKRELEREVKSMKEKTGKMLTNALIIGGSLAVTYFVISQVVKSKKKKKRVADSQDNGVHSTPETEEVSAVPSLISQIGTKVINQATLLLLDLAKEKLIEYLETRKQLNENS